MRRSVSVLAPLLAATAAAVLTGCRSSEPERCVDSNNRVVDESFCKNLPAQSTNQQNLTGNTTTTGTHFIPMYHWYYGGARTPLGGIVSGGSATPLAGHSYSTSTTRGGFGSSFGHGGGE